MLSEVPPGNGGLALRRAVVLVFAAAAAAVHADGSPPPVLSYAGPAELVLGPSRALASESGLFTNPAAIQATRRFALDAQGLLGYTGGNYSEHAFQLSSVDSQSTSLAVGAAFSKLQSGSLRGTATTLALAHALFGNSLQIGVAGHLLELHGRAQVETVTGDAGFAWQFGAFRLGGAIANLHAPEAAAALPLTTGLGAAVQLAELQFVGDWTRRIPDGSGATDALGGGVAWTPCACATIRGGYLHDDSLGGHLAAAGLSFGSGALTADVGYRITPHGEHHQSIAAGVKLVVTAR